MKYSDQELRSIAARAIPLQERWSVIAGPDAAEDPESLRRLERWRHVLSVEGDEGLMAQRLSLDGITREACFRSLSLAECAGPGNPAWAERLNAFLEGYPAQAGTLFDCQTLSGTW